MWPDSPLFRGIQQRLIPQPKAGPTMDAWKARIPQDIDGKWPSQPRMPTNDEVLDMVSNVVTPMAGSIENVAGKAVKRGIEAWHGSPVKGITAFDSRKIGSGEGIQNYGHGHYLSKDKGVGEWYRDALSKDGDGALYRAELDIDPNRVMQFSAKLADQPQEVLGAAQNALQRVGNLDLASKPRQVLERIIQRVDPNGEWVGSGLSREDLLEAAKEMEIPDYLAQPITPQRDGRSVYEQLVTIFGGGGKSRGSGQVKASKLLQESGLHGLGHLEEQAAKGRGAQNYVVFDPKRIRILEALGLVGLAGGAVGSDRDSR